ncbi:MAG: helix-turn-helix domain-containing protein [Alphaproteobacteria bacterium]
MHTSLLRFCIRFEFVTVSILVVNVQAWIHQRSKRKEQTMTELSLSIEDACKITGIGRTKIYQAINAGRLKARKLGKRTIILKQDLEVFLDGLESYQAKSENAE